MNKKVIVVLLATFVMALLLGACRLPASTAPQATNTTVPDFPTPPVEETPEVVNNAFFSTQTSVAAEGGGAPQATVEPGAPAEPQAQPEVTQEPQAGGGQPGSDQAGGGIATPEVSGDQAGGGGPAEQPAAPAQEQAPAPAVELPPAPARPSSYTLKNGEYPYCIARRYDINAASLLSANGLGINSKLPIGYTLTIPATGTWNSGSRSLHAHPTNYTVRAGDTIYSIACYYGDVYPEFIAAANNLSAPYALTPGQTLQIP